MGREVKFLHNFPGWRELPGGGNGAQNSVILARESPESTQKRPKIARF